MELVGQTVVLIVKATLPIGRVVDAAVVAALAITSDAAVVAALAITS